MNAPARSPLRPVVRGLAALVAVLVCAAGAEARLDSDQGVDPASLAGSAGMQPTDASTTTESAAAPGAPTTSDAAGPTTPRTPPPFLVGAGFMEQFNASLDDGGRYGASRAYLSARARFELAPTLELNVGTAAAFSDYRFSGDVFSDAFAAAPWNRVVSVGLAPRLTWRMDEHWAVTAGPVVDFGFETGADLGDSFQWGGLAALRYSFDQDHTLGLGLLAITQLEDDPLFLPVPLVDWRLGDGWRISNIRGPEANPFAGVELIRELDAEWDIAFGAAYVTRRFRLDDDGPVPEGVGNDSGVPIFARLSWWPHPLIRFDLVAGASVLNRLTLDDSNGNRVASSNADPAPLLGIFGSIRF